ncbi:MAG: sorbosone dehydrogenase family protein [Bacillota bacterium]
MRVRAAAVLAAVLLLFLGGCSFRLPLPGNWKAPGTPAEDRKEPPVEDRKEPPAPDAGAPGESAATGGAGGGAALPGPLVPVELEVPPALAEGPFAEPRRLYLPAGFRIQVFAAGLGQARFMAVGPEGDLYLSIPREGRVVALPDRDGDGVADQVVTVAEGLDRPHGLAWHQGDLYVAENSRVIRLEFRDGAPTGAYQVVVPNLPRGGGHWTRTIAFGPDGKLYVSAGSSCNVCLEDDPRRAAITRYNPDGTGEEIYATGLRNSVGLAFHPETGELWATENGRDLLGDDFPPEEINRIEPGRHYGWPHCHGDRVPDPEFGRGFDCSATEPPAVMMQAHSAPLGLAFYTGDTFPAAYRGQLFVAFHGSWNRSVPTGYKVVLVPFRDGQPAGGPVDFLTGFLVGDRAWGRPVDLVVGGDGALYLSDDRAGAVYRIRYAGE